MYWKTKRPKPDFEPPTDTIRLPFAQWLEKAREIQDNPQHTKEEHLYFRLNAMLHNHAYLYEELPIFDPSLQKQLTVVKAEEHKGINCRFGMKGTLSFVFLISSYCLSHVLLVIVGTIAEAHYDTHNNFIALLGGHRR